ncbi:hypothetical protein JCM3774_004547 [Rhodotorula dairenensis]
MLDEANGADVNPTASTSRLSSAASAAIDAGKKRQRIAEVEASEPRSTGRVRKPPAAFAGYQVDLGLRRRRDQVEQPREPTSNSEPLAKRPRRHRFAESEAGSSSSARNPPQVSAPATVARNSAPASGGSKEGAPQAEKVTVKKAQPEQSRKRVLWSSSENERLRAAALTHAGLDPATGSIKGVDFKRPTDWLEVKRIFELLAPSSATNAPTRTPCAIQQHFDLVLLPAEPEPDAVAAVPAGLTGDIHDSAPPVSNQPSLLSSSSSFASVTGARTVQNSAAADTNVEGAVTPRGDTATELEDRTRKASDPEGQKDRRRNATQHGTVAAGLAAPERSLQAAAAPCLGPGGPVFPPESDLHHLDRADEPDLPTVLAKVARCSSLPLAGSNAALDIGACTTKCQDHTQTARPGTVGRGQSSPSAQVAALQAQRTGQEWSPKRIAPAAPTEPGSVGSTSAATSSSTVLSSSSSPNLATEPAPTTATAQVTSSAQRGLNALLAGNNAVAATAAGQQTSSNYMKHFSAEEDRLMMELRKIDVPWNTIALRLGRPQSGCCNRYSRLRRSAKLVGPPTSASNPLPLPPTFVAPAQAHAANSTLPPYTAEDDVIILRMYLQGKSAERIGVMIKRSALSVHRRWSKKRGGWIATGLLTTADQLRLHDEPVDEHASASTLTASAVGAPRVDSVPVSSLGNLPTTTAATSSFKATAVPTSESGSPVNDLGGEFDRSAFLSIDPALLDARIDGPNSTFSSTTRVAANVLSDRSLPSMEADSPPTRQELHHPRVAPSEHDALSGAEATATPAQMLAEAMPPYDSGMNGLHRFLQLVKAGAEKKKR